MELRLPRLAGLCAAALLAQACGGGGSGGGNPASFAIVRVSLTDASLPSHGGGIAVGPAHLSGNGRFAGFQSSSSDLVAGDHNAASDVFVHDRVSGATERVSIASDGTEGDSGSQFVSVSDDGRSVAFESFATNLVPSDTNGATDVFVRDRTAGTTVRASLLTGGIQALMGGAAPSLSGNGRYVAFHSQDGGYDFGDANFNNDVFVHDLQTGNTVLVSRSTAGAVGNGSSAFASVSDDGRFIAFNSTATNLVAGDTNGQGDVFVRDRDTDVDGIFDEPGNVSTVRANVHSGGAQAALGASGAAISGNGAYVAFSTWEPFDGGDTNGFSDVYVHHLATTTTVRVSVSSAGGLSAGGSGSPSLSASGRRVSFLGSNLGLVPGITGSQVYVHDRDLDGDLLFDEAGQISTSAASTTQAGAQGNAQSHPASLSDDGLTALFPSDASNLVAGDGNASTDLFAKDLGTGVVTRASLATGGAESLWGSLGSLGPAVLSSDGRYVAFASHSPDLVGGDTNADRDIFVRDRTAGTTSRVSLSSTGAQLSEESSLAGLSGDGIYVAFVTRSNAVVPGDSFGIADAFIRNRQTGATVRASTGTAETMESALSRDGNWLAFGSVATDVVAGDLNGVMDIFRYDRVGAVNLRVSVTNAGLESNGESRHPRISANGRYVAFRSSATNLVAGDSNARNDIFVRDTVTPGTVRISVRSDGSQATAHSDAAFMSDDGRFVAFMNGDPLEAGDTNGIADVYVHDRDPDVDGIFDEPGQISTVRASLSSAGAQANAGCIPAGISPDGRFVAFTSQAGNLVTGDTNGRTDVFVRDLQTAQTVRVSLSQSFGEPTQASFGGAFTADGRFVAFASTAPNLVPGDTNGVADVFVAPNLLAP